MWSKKFLHAWIPALTVIWFPLSLMGFDDSDSARTSQDSGNLVPKASDHETNTAANEKLVTDGITFGDLVKVLGPGWRPGESDAAELRWYFDDDAILAAQSSEPDDVMHFGTGGRLWWVAAPPEATAQPTALSLPPRQKIMSAISALRARPHFHQIFMTSAAVVLLVLSIMGLRWYTVVRNHSRTISGRLFIANKRLPALPWNGKFKENYKSRHEPADARSE